MTRLAAFQGIRSGIRSSALPLNPKDQAGSAEVQMAEMQRSHGPVALPGVNAIRSNGPLRLQCYADPHILLSNCS
jgi:hypothetical protein